MPRRESYRPWARAELDLLRQLAQSGNTSTDIARRLGRSNSSVRQQLHKQGWGLFTLARVGEYAEPEGPTLAEIMAPAAAQPEPDDVFLGRVLERAQASLARARSERMVTLRLASSRPVALSISSDWHVAPHGCDLPALFEYADYVARTPDLYAIAVGDLLDNPIKHRGGSVGQIADDLRVLDLLVGRFKGKLLGTTSGNHDDWTKVLSGGDHLRELARRHRLHYAPDELLWTVEIVEPTDPTNVTASYLIATRHQWRRHSNLNPLHACWTWLSEELANWPQIPDVLAIGHNHVAAHGAHQYEQRDVWGLRMGAWQIESPYARAKGFARFRSTAPTIVLPPTRADRLVAFSDAEDAVRYLGGTP